MLSTPAMVFQGGSDDWFGSLAPAQAAKFSNPLFLSSPNVGHDLPEWDDVNFPAILDFIRAGLVQSKFIFSSENINFLRHMYIATYTYLIVVHVIIYLNKQIRPVQQ